MKLSRIINRCFFYLQKQLITLVSYFNHRFYMKMYVPLLRKNGVKIIGVPRYIGANVKFDDFDKIQLGNRVVISDECILLTHDYSITTALIAIDESPKSDIALIRGITIDDNVFIGKRSIIMPNTKIGKNVIIGAGSVVRGDIPDNSIVMGNPCSVIGNIKEQANKWKKYLETDKIRQD